MARSTARRGSLRKSITDTLRNELLCKGTHKVASIGQAEGEVMNRICESRFYRRGSFSGLLSSGFTSRTECFSHIFKMPLGRFRLLILLIFVHKINFLLLTLNHIIEKSFIIM